MFLWDSLDAPASSCFIINGDQATSYDPLASYTYQWNSGNWGTCTGACGTGNGTQSRTVYCKRSDGIQVSDSFCTGSKPSTTQACTASACTSYSWYTGNWSTCSGACGSGNGTQSRTVYCQSSSGSQVSDSSCTGSKPSTTQSCTASACPVGALEFQLTWTHNSTDTGPDLDLHVVDPAGIQWYFRNAINHSNPNLDIDDQGACSRSNDGDGPERMYWSSPARGTYSYYVHWYTNCSAATSSSYTLRVFVNGSVVETRSGTITSGDSTKYQYTY